MLFKENNRSLQLESYRTHKYTTAYSVTDS
jgi:hypothetical protein